MNNLAGIPEGGRYHSKGNYDVRFIKEVVKDISEGLSQVGAAVKYGLNKWTVKSWVEKYGDEFQFVSRKQLSIQDKRTAVRAIKDGRLSVKEVALAYGISPNSVKGWQKLYASENIELSPSNLEHLAKNKKASLPKQDELKRLQSQLAEAQLNIAALNTLIDVAEEKLKISIRKKPGAGQS